MTIGDRIKELRKDKKMTQETFASAIGLKRNTVATYETIGKAPLDAIIKSICQKFSVSEDWLRHGVGDMYVDQPNQQTALALESFKMLNPEYQDYVLKQIDMLIKLQSKPTEDS